MKYHVHKQKGFTLVETLVAVAVLLVAVAAVFTAAQSGLSSSSGLRNRVTATYLAEEGVNGVKNLKDTNLLQVLVDDGATWLSGISECDSGSPCGYDILDNSGVGSLNRCTALEQCKVKSGSYNGDETIIYRQSPASDNNGTTVETGFTRKIWIEETLGGKEAKVTVEITRPGTSFTPYRIETYIYNYWPTP